MRTMEEQGSAVEPKVAWEPPADMDPECITLCAALNKLPGIQTFESCCGHKNDPKKNDMFKHNFWVFFLANSLEARAMLPVSSNGPAARARTVSPMSVRCAPESPASCRHAPKALSE